MFKTGFPRHWSTLKKLVWLYAIMGGGGGSSVTVCAAGVSPLSLVNAVAAQLVSLTQYGLCTQDANGDIYCNNGKLVKSPNLMNASAANTTLGVYINKVDGVVKDSPYNFMFDSYMPVEPGVTYVAYGRAKVGNDLSDYNRVAWYDANKDWLSGAAYTQNQIAVVTAPAGAAYARFSCNPSGGTTTAVTQEIVDSYFWVFQQGSAEPSTVYPYGALVEGTAEVLSVCGKNIITNTPDGQGTYASPSALTTTRIYKAFPKLTAGATYTISISTGYDLIVQRKKDGSGENVGSWETAKTFTAEAGYSYGIAIRLPDNAAITPEGFAGTLQLELGSTATDYEAYTAQTASVADLFSVGPVEDEQEFCGGTLTRRVTACLYDGTQTIGDTFLSTTGGLDEGAIIVYPLAEPTTEQTTPQPLNTAEGTNTITVTANVSGIVLNAAYEAKPQPEIAVEQSGTLLAVNYIAPVTTVTQSGTTLVLE